MPIASSSMDPTLETGPRRHRPGRPERTTGGGGMGEHSGKARPVIGSRSGSTDCDRLLTAQISRCQEAEGLLQLVQAIQRDSGTSCRSQGGVLRGFRELRADPTVSRPITAYEEKEGFPNPIHVSAVAAALVRIARKSGSSSSRGLPVAVDGKLRPGVVAAEALSAPGEAAALSAVEEWLVRLVAFPLPGQPLLPPTTLGNSGGQPPPAGIMVRMSSPSSERGGGGGGGALPGEGSGFLSRCGARDLSSIAWALAKTRPWDRR